MLQPMIPPPMITMRACDGTDGIAAKLAAPVRVSPARTGGPETLVWAAFRGVGKVTPMDHRRLGNTGTEVSRIILGCGSFGGIGSAPEFFGQGISKRDAFALMDAAWDAGITTFDTADAYGGGSSETFLGEWLATKQSSVR